MTVLTPTPTPFRKILIANRGEIALRIIRSARALGYRTVAVYSTADAEARHVREADQAVCVGEPLPAQSYLRIDAIINAASRSGADAVHPGYGFLAENAEFAKACKEAGLVFIGPSAEAIASMGHKAGAKTLMKAAGVPCIPGYQGDDQSEHRLAAEAGHIGFPVMIKAASGGGGRGMRLASSAAEFHELLRSARSEALGAFGDPEVILERAIAEPRHIEIQVFADRYGHVIHLGERDCSVQRRHQKLIEEAPSPAVDAELRERMGATAVAAIKALRYEGAGTLEFLLDKDRSFYFMEMNTRLQVEHPVTEAVTGLDLVEMQLRIAAGEPLTLSQQQVQFSGHAIEVRLCAEDADHGFIPRSGRMALWKMPLALRVEEALGSGFDIPPFYDSMIAKLISHGRTREEARRKLANGLQDAVALGVTTNQFFLQRCLAHPVFGEGRATTAFIAQHQEVLLAKEEGLHGRAAALSAVLLSQSIGIRDGKLISQGLVHNLPITLSLDLDGRSVNANIAVSRGRLFHVSMEARTFNIGLVQVDGCAVRFTCDGLQEGAAFHRDGTTLWLQYGGMSMRVEDKTRAASVRQGEAASDGKLRASMNGRVVSVMVGVGDTVRTGQPIITLEAMKMEHVHAAPISGKVIALHVGTGDQIAASRVVAEIEVALPG